MKKHIGKFVYMANFPCFWSDDAYELRYVHQF